MFTAEKVNILCVWNDGNKECDAQRWCFDVNNLQDKMSQTDFNDNNDKF